MKITVSLSRNIVNIDAIDNWLQTIKTHNEPIDKWIQSNLRNWLIKKCPSVRPHYKATRLDPKWVQKAIKEGQHLESVLLDSDLKQTIEHAIGYLRTVKNVHNISVPQAIEAGEAYIAKENAKASDKDGYTSTIYYCDNGYEWVKCLDKQSLHREGKLMGHCVGSEMQEYISKVASRTCEIWSLRDNNNMPHCTIEYDARLERIVQIKGKQNRGVVAKYTKYCQTLLKHLDIDCDEDELINIGVLVKGGIWYDLYNLPDGFVYDDTLNLSVDNDDTDGVTHNVILPNNLITKSLNLYNNHYITKLPKGLIVRGSLDISFTNIEILPDDIKVGNILNCRGSKLKTLPDNMTVNRLILSNTPIKSLPKGLTVLEVLDLEDCNVTLIPDDAKIQNLHLGGSKVEKLCEGLTILGDLNLSDSFVKEIPKNVSVGGNLMLYRSKIKTLPPTLSVGGAVSNDPNSTLAVSKDCSLKFVFGRKVAYV